jgi:hypothetical protein
LRLVALDGGNNFCHPGFFSPQWEHSGGQFWRSVCRSNLQLAVGGGPLHH